MTTYDGTVAALEAIVDRAAADGDRNGYFPAMYLAVTRTVRARAEAGRFADAVRMERFVSAFAARYLAAHRAWSAGGECSESWRLAFEAGRRRRPIVLQHLLLGMNAHINLDLGVSAAEVGEGGPLEAVRADFDAINDVLGELVDGSQAVLGEVSPWLALVDRVGGSGDETLIRFSLRAARRQAWTVAQRLSGVTGAARHEAILAVDALTVEIGRAVEHPGVPASVVLLLVRARERVHPAEVIRLLAAVRPPI
jgi:Family of unknown function (DUF5995)